MNSRRFLTVCALLLCGATIAICADAAVTAEQAKERYDQANALLQQGKTAEAISSWQSLIGEAADQKEICAKAQLGIGTAFYRSGDTEKALEAYRQVVSGYQSFSSVAAEAQVHIGEAYQNQNMCTEAVSAYEAVVAKFPSEQDWCIAALGKMGRTYRASDKLYDALLSFKRIVDGYPTRPEAVAEAMLTRAEIYEQKQDYDPARLECKKLISTYSKNKSMKGYCRQAQFKLPCLLKGAGRLQEALDEFAKVTPVPDDPADTCAMMALYKRAQIFHDIGEPKKALTELKTLIASYPQHKNTSAQSKMLMARCLSETGDYAGARKVLKELTADPTVQGSSLLTKELAALEAEIGTQGEAQEAFRNYSATLAKSGDSDKSDFGQLELAYHIKHDLQEAGPLAAKCIRKYPNDPRVAGALFIQGEYLMSTGDTAEALKSFDTLITKYGNKPGNEYDCAYAKIEKASCLISLDPAAAREVLKDLSSDTTVKRHTNLLHHLAELQRRIGESSWQTSARDYVAAMAKTDPAAGEFAKLEIAYHFENNISEAAKLAAEFVKKNPQHGLAPEASLIGGNCLLRSDDKEGALAAFEAMLKAYGHVPGARVYRNRALELSAEVLLGFGRQREALQRLDQIVAADPYEATRKLDLVGLAYRQAGDWRKAAGAFRRETGYAGAPAESVYRGLYNLADCYFHMADPMSARRSLEKVMDSAPESSWAEKARGLLYSQGITESPTGQP